MQPLSHSWLTLVDSGSSLANLETVLFLFRQVFMSRLFKRLVNFEATRDVATLGIKFMYTNQVCDGVGGILVLSKRTLARHVVRLIHKCFQPHLRKIWLMESEDIYEIKPGQH
ncbi:hypothetical protein GALMADRAFT_253550 [Galerina marginata CBS 339.88]|uniref:Uncharacterized protein n=1 Tax=Galerina marginata (strain CBS 339.88) TaxID=685588 RepID=A0A067SVR4_GALM3|nr:hypothetical protein GALMADRAFT_253550 [Galerina marginata CBS 339.88]